MSSKSIASRYERGQSLIELAFGVSFMILLLAGIVDLGRAFFSFMSLRDAAQEGALYGSLHPTNTNGIEARIHGISDTPIDMDLVTISPTLLGPACAGSRIEITITYQFPITMPFLGAIIGSQTVPMSTTVTDYIISPPCPST